MVPGGESWMGPAEGAGPRALAPGRGPVGKEVGEAWEGKVETENGGRAPGRGLRPPQAALGREQSGAKRGGVPWATCYPGLRHNPWASRQRFFKHRQALQANFRLCGVQEHKILSSRIPVRVAA